MKREELIARLRELANDGVLSTKYAAAVFQAAAMLEADGKKDWPGTPEDQDRRASEEDQYPQQETEEEILKIVRDASRGSATRRDGTTSMRIARAIEAKVRGEA